MLSNYFINSQKNFQKLDLTVLRGEVRILLCDVK